MTQEQKAKAYDEALERAKKWRNAPNIEKIPTFGDRIIEEIFPELKESDNERIRKEMISWLKGFIGEEEGCGYTEDEIKERIAWLEKQGEQKPKRMISAEAKEAMYNKPADEYDSLTDFGKQMKK